MPDHPHETAPQSATMVSMRFNSIPIDSFGAWTFKTDSELDRILPLTDGEWIALYNLGLRKLRVYRSLTSALGFLTLKSKIENLNYLANIFACPCLSLELYDTLDADQPILNISRRRLFSALLPNLRELSPPRKERLETNHFPYFVQLDPAKCTACNACVHVCTSEAIAVDPNLSAYTHRALSCDGCGLCSEVCDAAALTITPLQVEQAPPLPILQLLAIEKKSCRHCGHQFQVNPYHPTEPTVLNSDLCSVCRKHRHLKGDLRIWDSNTTEQER